MYYFTWIIYRCLYLRAHILYGSWVIICDLECKRIPTQRNPTRCTYYLLYISTAFIEWYILLTKYHTCNICRAVLYHLQKDKISRARVPLSRLGSRVSTEFRRHGIPRNFLTSEVISAQFRRNSAKFRGIPRNFAGIEPEITSVFRGMPKCHFRGHPN